MAIRRYMGSMRKSRFSRFKQGGFDENFVAGITAWRAAPLI